MQKVQWSYLSTAPPTSSPATSTRSRKKKYGIIMTSLLFIFNNFSPTCPLTVWCSIMPVVIIVFSCFIVSVKCFRQLLSFNFRVFHIRVVVLQQQCVVFRCPFVRYHHLCWCWHFELDAMSWSSDWCEYNWWGRWWWCRLHPSEFVETSEIWARLEVTDIWDSLQIYGMLDYGMYFLCVTIVMIGLPKLARIKR